MLPWILSVVLLLSTSILAIKLHFIKVGLNEIYDRLDKHINTDTNGLIMLSSNDRLLKNFAHKLNVQLQQLQRQRLLYQNGDRELKEAVTNILHDLRTPLTSMCGYLDLIKVENDQKKINSYIELLQSKTDTLKLMTEQLFRYSVIMSTVDDLCMEKVNINSLLEESIVEFYASLNKAEIVPKLNITQKQLYCHADKVALKRIFNNIISNAIRYSDKDLHIVLNDNSEVIFTNTANSLSGVDVGRLFNRFFSVSTASNTTGLGLSISKTLSQQMNMNISAEYKNSKLSICIDLNNMQ